MNDILTLAVAAAVGVLVIFGLANFLTHKRPRKLNKAYYQEKWQSTTTLCKEKSTWPLAIIDADKLLDDVLKKSHYKGKTMGERLVSAQRAIRDNDGVWYGHKLRNRLVHESDIHLREQDVKDALSGIRAAMRDLGAL